MSIVDGGGQDSGGAFPQVGGQPDPSPSQTEDDKVHLLGVGQEEHEAVQSPASNRQPHRHTDNQETRQSRAASENLGTQLKHPHPVVMETNLFLKAPGLMRKVM